MAVTTASMFIAATFLGTCVRENTPTTTTDDCPEFVSNTCDRCVYLCLCRESGQFSNLASLGSPIFLTYTYGSCFSVWNIEKLGMEPGNETRPIVTLHA